ncbi:DUF927 domain-containing protein [Rhizobium sp. NXC14]|uniref:DUF927 domain-containing protein n=1 Tax=Rhizobium sp. NXC14 TaxID=1981173 RepID=UPI000A26719D|nr:DUF927 domain-containing protein [Rhizobium sp. NXC14]
MSKDLEIRITDGVEVEGEKIPYALVAVRQRGQCDIEIPIPAHELIDQGRCIETLIKHGLNYTYDRKLLAAAFEEAVRSKTTHKINIATRPGFHGDEFLFNHEMISRKNSESSWIADPRLRSRGARTEIETDEQLEVLLAKWMPKSPFLQFIIMATFAAPVFALLNEPEMPIIHIYGERKTGKTTLLHVANAFQRDAHNRKLHPFNFSTTGIEEKLVEANHSLLCLDETGNVSRSDLAKIVETYLYYITGGESRLRPSRLFSDVSWRSSVAFTGEFSLTEIETRRTGSGQDARLISIAVPKNGILCSSAAGAETNLALAEIAKACETYSGRLYRRWIAKIVNYGAGEAKIQFQELSSKYQKKLIDDREADGLVGTLARKFAVIAAVGSCLENIKAFPEGSLSSFATVLAFLEADLAEKRANTTAPYGGALASCALEILANIAAKDIPRLHLNGKGQLQTSTCAFIDEKKGREYLYIYKDSVPQFMSRSAADVFELLKSEQGLLQGSRGPNTYGQFKPPGGGRRSVMQIDFEMLKKIALPNYINLTPNAGPSR